MNNYIGIDVAKATLQVFVPKNELDIEIENNVDSLKKLHAKLKKHYKKEMDKVVFIYESTGSYSTILEYFCQLKKIKCFKVGAYQSASFAKTIKNRNKTDKVDAKMLSQMHILIKEGDIKVPSRDDKAHQIRSFIKYYQSLIKEEIRLKNYLEAAIYNFEDKYILQEVKKRIAKIKKDQDIIVDKVMQIIESNSCYFEAYENIISIKGVGQKSAIVLPYFFIRYPKCIKTTYCCTLWS